MIKTKNHNNEQLTDFISADLYKVESPAYKIKDLPHHEKNILNVVVESKGEVKEAVLKDGSKHSVCDCLISDSTGKVMLSLWNNKIDTVEVGDKLELCDVELTEFNGQTRIKIGLKGSMRNLGKATKETQVDLKKINGGM